MDVVYPIFDLPHEIIECIITFMSPVAATLAARTNKRMHTIVRTIHKIDIASNDDIINDRHTGRSIFYYICDLIPQPHEHLLLKFGDLDRFDALELEFQHKFIDKYRYSTNYSRSAAYHGQIYNLRLHEYRKGATYQINDTDDTNCERSLQAFAISGGQLHIVKHLIERGYKIFTGHIIIALIYSAEIFHYLTANKYPNVYKCILNTTHEFTHNCLSPRIIIDKAINDSKEQILQLLAEIDRNLVRERIINQDAASAYMVIFGDSCIITDIITSDAVNIFAALNNSPITTCKDTYTAALKARALKIIKHLGLRLDMLEDIILTNCRQILDLFPELATEDTYNFAKYHCCDGTMAWARKNGGNK